MAVSIADIQKIRKMTGAGLADCKKALTELKATLTRQYKSSVRRVRLSLLNVATARHLTAVYSLRLTMVSLP